MTAAITRGAGLSRQMQDMYRATMSDLNRAISGTTQEMAEKRTGDYFADRTNSKGLADVYYSLLTAIAIDPSQSAEKLIQQAAPKVKDDIKLLETIRISGEKGSVEGLKDAMKAGLTKDVLVKLFDVTTWNSFFGSERPQMVKAVEHIAAAIQVAEIVEAKIEEAAKPIINKVTVPSKEKRKPEAPPAAQPEPKKEKPLAERQVSRYSEDDKKIDDAIIAHIIAQEAKEQEEKANEALARELQEQLDAQTARDAETAQRLADENDQRAIDAVIYDE